MNTSIKIEDKTMVENSEATSDKQAVDCVDTTKYIYFFDYHSDLTKAPVELIHEQSAFESSKNNFLKGCKWSPNGRHLLTNSEDRFLRIFSLPDELTNFFNSNVGGENDQNLVNNESSDTTAVDVKVESDSVSLSLNLINTCKPGDLVYDYCWHPSALQQNNDGVLFAYTSKNRPIHLRDIHRPGLVASFNAINHVDELACANSICFSTDGRKLYAGFRNCVRIFDFLRPGRQIMDKDTRGNKHFGNGQPGIISCIAASPTHPGIYICGSYNRTIGLYTEELKDPQFVLQGHLGGITHLVFHPNGDLIYSGGRKDNEILCWDIRQLGEVLCIFEREVNTNQRIYFDIDRKGNYLISGNSGGSIKIWDLKNPANRITFQAHQDCVNGVSFNPFAPLIASSSGQRKCADSFLNEFFSEEEDDEPASDCPVPKNNLHKFDNSVKIWKFI